MEHLAGGTDSSNNANELEVTNSQLISGLPDDISLFCLARVPRKYHSVLKCVSKRWRDLVCSEEWHSYRQKHKLAETWIYALCRDRFKEISCYVLDPTSSRRCWKLLQELPPHLSKRKGMGFEVLGKKLFLLGGCGWSEGATNEVYAFDACLNSWIEAAPLSTARCYFACEVLDEKIYAIGGLGSNSSDPHSWDTYDPCINSWKSHKDSNIVPEIEDSVVMDGWRGPAVVVDGVLYVLDQSSGTRLMMWQKEKRLWMPVGKLSPLLTRPPCQLVAVGKSIFVVGKGLSTVVVDVRDVGNMGKVMVGSSIPKLISSDDDVISCKCLAI
ncbi:F-box/kelch-repeat protein SKIP4 isoform X2 [Prosopis cineraria]|uniref:F-box/kelch-repeat protein SKIP4 isoform X2 n=1 Tax=Prosopis cineraria TaxID=364024 RepID=UPI00240F6397|nr:F-box/kelch-repeat protein SKIP4 isoform X2 [Prosopis cineraria]